ncbi:nectin-1-like isoform X2 [Pelobates cultripes]|uniref:Nectin-1-like isoform X2 n=1 Tax=Pelobates cultripes TaxID=61616 RepID=A0AAD1QWP6_PELCU|nr:nectin-1-like isoform X2 [Pelobates cultripes]
MSVTRSSGNVRPQFWGFGILFVLQALCAQPAGSQDPQIFLEPSTIPLKEGDPEGILAECIAIANPAPVIKWNTGDFTHNIDNSVQQHENLSVTVVSKLKMKPLRDLYGQNFTCVVTQMQTEWKQEKSVTIWNIHFAPYDVRVLVDSSKGNHLEFSCLYNCNPVPLNFTWKRVSNSGTEYIKATNHLTVPNNMNKVLYVCEVRNSLGSMSGSTYIYSKKGSFKFAMSMNNMLLLVFRI